MAQMPTLRTISNGTPADATDPEYNFDTIEVHLANEVINRDGSVAMQGPLVLSGPPVTDSQAATKGFVESMRFPGEIVEYGGDVAPTGWALCNGQTQSSTDPNFATLFAVIGYKFGDAGGGNFKLPDFRKRVSVGRDTAVPEFDTVGETGGDANGVAAHSHIHSHTIEGFNFLTVGAGAHSHSLKNGAVFLDISGSGSASLDTGGGLTAVSDTFSEVGTHQHTVAFPTRETEEADQSTGTANGNYPPFVVVTKIVKL